MEYYKWTNRRKNKTGRAAIFLDRDGVINHDYGYISEVSKFKFISGSLSALKLLSQSKYIIIVVTNQSGIGRGYFSLNDFIAINREMIRLLQSNSIDIDAIFMCPHHPDLNCKCRKPQTKMFLDAISTYDLLIDECYMIGDKMTDIEAGKRVGIRNCILIKQDNGGIHDNVRNECSQVADLFHAAQMILGLHHEDIA